MGSAVGEKFLRARDSRSSAACRSSRLRAGRCAHAGRDLSLMQLPKSVCAVEELHDARLPMLDRDGAPDHRRTCSRRFAVLGDVTIAEPGALIRVHRPACAADHARGSCRRTSVSPSRTSASVTWTASFRDLSSASTSSGSCGSSERARDRPRARGQPASAAASRLPPARAARRRGARLERQLERLQAGRATQAIWRSVERLRAPPGQALHDGLRRAPAGRLGRVHGDRGRADDALSSPASARRRPHHRTRRPSKGT